MGLLKFLRSKCKVGFQLCFLRIKKFLRNFLPNFARKLRNFFGKRNFKFLIKKTECIAKVELTQKPKAFTFFGHKQDSVMNLVHEPTVGALEKNEKS